MGLADLPPTRPATGEQFRHTDTREHPDFPYIFKVFISDIPLICLYKDQRGNQPLFG